MKNSAKLFFNLCILLSVFIAVSCKTTTDGEQRKTTLTMIEETPLSYVLPTPQVDGTMSVEHAMANRRTHRNFIDTAISAEQLSQILWSAYGISDTKSERAQARGGLRTAPSAGALYPFEVYAVVGNVTGIEAGVYKYHAAENKITKAMDGDIREELSAACLGQVQVKSAPVSILYAAIYSKSMQRYGDRGRDRYVCMDIGHSAQNVYLQAESLNLGTCAMGAFNDEQVAELMQLPEEEVTLYIMPVGYYYKN